MKNIFLLSLLMVLGLGNPAAEASDCSSAYPHGLTGSGRTVVNVTLPGNTGNGFYLKNPLDQINYVEQEISQKAAANPNGSQFQFVNVQQAQHSDLFLGVILYGQFSGGNDYDWLLGNALAVPIGTGWAVVNASGLNSGTDWLFNVSTHSYTFDQDHQPLNAILDEAAAILYQYLANGWTCN